MSQRTITRHWPRSSPQGDYQATCDYCGVQWRRSQLRRDASGLLACPDDQPGLDAVSLSKGNAEAMSLGKRRVVSRDGSNWDGPQTDVAPEFTPPGNPQQLPPRGFGG